MLILQAHFDKIEESIKIQYAVITLNDNLRQ